MTGKDDCNNEMLEILTAEGVLEGLRESVSCITRFAIFHSDGIPPDMISRSFKLVNDWKDTLKDYLNGKCIHEKYSCLDGCDDDLAKNKK